MIGGILLLAMAVFGLSILFGKGKPENYYRFLIWLIVSPVLVGIASSHLLYVWQNFPWWLQAFCVLLAPFILSFVLRIAFPKVKWLAELSHNIFQFLIYLATFPFRFLWRAGGFIAAQERRTQRLNPRRPVVGQRPPLQNERREGHRGRNEFDW